MRLLELVLQDVAGSPGLSRLPVKGGVTFLSAGAAGPAPLQRLVAYVLYDESVEPPPDLRAPGGATPRVGATVQDPAGNTYRVIRDLTTGAAQLHRFDPARKSFVGVSERAPEIGQYLRSQARVPSEDLFLDLFSLTESHLPTRRPVKAAGGEAGAGPSRFGGLGGRGGGPKLIPSAGFPGFQGGGGGGGGVSPGGAEPDPFGHLTVDQKRAQLAELQQKKRAIDDLDELQFRLDGLQRKAFELEDGSKKVSAAEEAVRVQEEALAAFSDLERIPEGFEKRVRELGFLSDQLDRNLERITGERDTLTQRAALPPAPPVRHPVLLGGLGATVVLTGVALLVEPLHWVAALNPVALGASAFVALRYLGERKEHDDLAGRVEALGEKAQSARRQFEIETSVVRKLMRELRIDTPEALLARLDKQRAAAQQLEEARAHLEAVRTDPALAQARSAREQVQAEIAAVEAQLQAAGGYGADVGDLMRDMGALERSIERAERGDPEPAAAAPEPQPLAAAATEAGTGIPDPTPVLLARLCDVFHTDVDTAAARIRERLAQYVAALSGNAYGSAAIEGLGSLQLTGPRGSVGWDGLSAADQDLVYVALHLTCMEAAVRVEPQPLVIAGVFDRLTPPQKSVAAKMLRFLGGLTQVILHSADPAWGAVAQTKHALR